MNKLSLLALLLINLIFLSNSSAQWTNGGTQISSGNLSYHRPMISPTYDGAAYITYAGANASIAGRIFLSKIDADGNNLFSGDASKLISNNDSCNAPVIITCEDDGAIVAWHGKPSGTKSYYIYAQKFDKNGNALWNNGNPMQVSVSDNSIDKYPMIVSDKHNGCYITWTRYDINISANSPDVLLQHIDNTGNVADGWNAAGTAVAITSNLREYYPNLILSHDESAVCILYNVGGATDPGGVSIKMKKVNTADGTLANTWNTNGITISSGPDVNPTLSINQYLFINNENYVTVFWLDNQGISINWEAYMQKVNLSDGAKIFATNGKCIGANNYTGTAYMGVSKDANGDFLVAFMNFTTGSDIDVLKIASDGTNIWSKLPATTNHNSAYPVPVSDGNGGMYVFYQNKETTPPQLFAIGLDALGNNKAGFPESGINFGEISRYDFFPNFDFNVVAAKSGTAIVAWDKNAGDLFNIYSCNLLPNGLNCAPLSSSVKEIETNINAEIFPNPFTNYINITTRLRTTNLELFFKLYNITGKLIMEKELNNSTNQQINNSNLPNGMYFYNISSGDNSIKKGILIKQ